MQRAQLNLFYIEDKAIDWMLLYYSGMEQRQV